MMMPAPSLTFTQISQAAPSDQVPETDVLLRLLLDEEMPMKASGDEELLDPASPDSLAMYEYLAQNGTYDIMMAEALVSDQGNQDGVNVNGVPDDGPMEDEEWFVPLLPGRLQCSDCRVVRQIRVQTGNKRPFIHSAALIVYLQD
jgi:hypothetical protein